MNPRPTFYKGAGGHENRRRRAILVALAALLVIAFILYRLRGTSFHWQRFAATFQHVHWGWLTVSILLVFLTYLGRALRWEVMLRPLGRTPGIWKLTTDTAIGFTAVVLLGRAGEVVRPYLISVRAGVPFSSQLAAWLLERVLDLLAVLLIFGFALTRIPAHGLALGRGLQWVLGAGGYLVTAIGAACVVFLVLFRNFAEPVQERLLSALTFLPENHYRRIESMLRAFSQGMESTRDLGFLGLLVAYSVALWAVIIGCYYTLFLAFPATAGLNSTDVVVFLGFVAFGSIVQIPGIGGGMQVVSIVVLTQIYGLGFEAATGVALFIWLVTFVAVVPAGLVCAFHEGLNWSKLKHLQENVPL